MPVNSLRPNSARQPNIRAREIHVIRLISGPIYVDPADMRANICGSGANICGSGRHAGQYMWIRSQYMWIRGQYMWIRSTYGPIRPANAPRPSCGSRPACAIELFGNEGRHPNIRRIYSVGAGFHNYNSARIRSNCMAGQTNSISALFAPVQPVAHANSL